MYDELVDSLSGTFQYAIAYDTLGLTSDDIARGMGYVDGAQSTYFAQDLENLLREAPGHVHIEGGFRVFPPEHVSIDREGFRIADQYFETGRIIAGPLRGAETLALFVATAGAGITRWTRDLMAEKEHIQAYFVDALGSETVEKAADWLEEQIIGWSLERGHHTTNRYSPGYCGWSVSEQHKLFSLLPAGFCGIALTESALMQPEKSVSGVIGIGGKAKKRAYACKICTMENCFRRNSRIA